MVSKMDGEIANTPAIPSTHTAEIQSLRAKNEDQEKMIVELYSNVKNVRDDITKISLILDIFDVRSDSFTLDSLFNSDKEQNLFMEQKSRISKLEDDIENLKSMLLTDSGNVSQKRAIALKEALGDSGHITRRQAKGLLGNCHHETAKRAMELADSMFSHLKLVKNPRTREVILMVVQQ